MTHFPPLLTEVTFSRLVTIPALHRGREFKRLQVCLFGNETRFIRPQKNIYWPVKKNPEENRKEQNFVVLLTLPALGLKLSFFLLLWQHPKLFTCSLSNFKKQNGTIRKRTVKKKKKSLIVSFSKLASKIVIWTAYCAARLKFF